MKEEVQILKLHQNDLKHFIQLVELFNEVFEEYHAIASEKQLKKLLTKTDFLAVVAVQNDQVVGGLTAYEMERYYSDSSELYLYDIAVKTQFHNQGIGKALMNYLKEYAIKNNIETIFVEAHSEDKPAVKFYESVIGQSEKVDHFNWEIKNTVK